MADYFMNATTIGMHSSNFPNQLNKNFVSKKDIKNLHPRTFVIYEINEEVPKMIIGDQKGYEVTRKCKSSNGKILQLLNVSLKSQKSVSEIEQL